MSVSLAYTNQLSREVGRMAAPLKLVFGLMCAERNEVWLRGRIKSGEQGDADVIHKVLDRLWQHASGRHPLTRGAVEALTKDLEASDRYTDQDPGTDGASIMHECCNITGSCAEYVVHPSDAKILTAASSSYELLSLAVYENKKRELVGRFGPTLMDVDLGSPRLNTFAPEIVSARRELIRDNDAFYPHPSVADEAIKQFADLAVLRSMPPKVGQDFDVMRRHAIEGLWS